MQDWHADSPKPSQRLRRAGLDTQQGIVGSLTTITGVVANLGTVLMAEGRDDRTVEIEDETRTMVGEMNEVVQQSIVYSVKTFPELQWRLH